MCSSLGPKHLLLELFWLVFPAKCLETNYTYILCVCLYTVCVCVCAYSNDNVYTMAYSCVTTSSESATHDKEGSDESNECMTVSYKESHERFIMLNRSGGSYVEIRACNQFCSQGTKQIASIIQQLRGYLTFLSSLLHSVIKGTESVMT